MHMPIHRPRGLGMAEIDAIYCYLLLLPLPIIYHKYLYRFLEPGIAFWHAGLYHTYLFTCKIPKLYLYCISYNTILLLLPLPHYHLTYTQPPGRILTFGPFWHPLPML